MPICFKTPNTTLYIALISVVVKYNGKFCIKFIKIPYKHERGGIQIVA